MSPPEWFGQRRYGLMVHLTVASVPAFAPVGEYAEWYWSHWSPEPLADVLLHPAPLPEVLAWHAEHHPHVTRFDDFIPGLTLDRFEADGLADLAVDAGARYLVPVSKHHDGFCWWHSAHTDRTSTRLGPRRDVLAELAAAAARHDLVFGLYHSLLDWAHGSSSAAYVTRVLHPQIDELVERFAPAVLWGDGHWGHGPDHWRTEELVERYRTRMDRLGLPAMVNDRWWAAEPDVVTPEYDPPAVPPDGPWELCRGLGHSFGYNRAERADDHLDAAGIVDLVTEVVAKGGNLLLNVGPRADGTVPDEQAQPLREAGRWVRRHHEAIHGSRPFDVWGDDELRFTRSGDDTVHVVDLRSRPARTIAHLSPHRYPVEEVVGAGAWSQDEGGLHLEAAPDDTGLGTVHRIRLRARRRITLAVRGEPGPGTVAIGPRRFATVAGALSDAAPGEVVLLGPGHHGPGAESFPLRVPAGVTLKGAGPATTVDGGGLAFGTTVVVLDGAGAALEELVVRGAASPIVFLTSPAVVAAGVDGVRVECCTVDGSIAVAGGCDVVIAWNVVERGSIAADECARASLLGNRQSGLPWGVGLAVTGGAGHRIEANTAIGALCAMRLDRCHDAVASANLVDGRWWSLHLRHSHRCRVVGNRALGMRAYTVSGGAGNEVEANVADGTDTGVLLEDDATATVVTGNHLTRCRVGVLAWEHTGSTIGGNVVVASRDHDRLDAAGGPLSGPAARRVP